MFYAKENGSLPQHEEAARKEAPQREMAVLALPFIKATTCLYCAVSVVRNSGKYRCITNHLEYSRVIIAQKKSSANQ